MQNVGDGFSLDLNSYFINERIFRMVVAYSEQNDQGIEDHFLFRTYDHTDHLWPSTVLNPGSAHDIPIWKVARATAAAPLYFESIVVNNMTLFDGGLGANNPSFIALREVLQMNDNSSKCLLVSIGTGWNGQDQTNDLKLVRHRWGFRKYWWLKDIFLNYALNSERIHKNEVSFVTHAAGVRYYRFNIVNHEINDIKLDSWEPVQGGDNTLQKIRNITREYLQNEDIMKQLLNCAHDLVNCREYRKARGCSMEDWSTYWEDIRQGEPAFSAPDDIIPFRTRRVYRRVTEIN